MNLPRILAFSVLALASTLQSAEPLEFGLVDFDRCQRAFFKSAIEQTAFKEKTEKDRQQIDDLRDDLKGLIDSQKFDSTAIQNPSISETTKASILRKVKIREGEIAILQQDLIKAEQEESARLTEEARKARQRLSKEIHAVIREVGDEHDMDVILNLSPDANGDHSAIVLKDNLERDITMEVIERLNRLAPEG